MRSRSLVDLGADEGLAPLAAGWGLLRSIRDDGGWSEGDRGNRRLAGRGRGRSRRGVRCCSRGRGRRLCCRWPCGWWPCCRGAGDRSSCRSGPSSGGGLIEIRSTVGSAESKENATMIATLATKTAANARMNPFRLGATAAKRSATSLLRPHSLAFQMPLGGRPAEYSQP